MITRSNLANILSGFSTKVKSKRYFKKKRGVKIPVTRTWGSIVDSIERQVGSLKETRELVSTYFWIKAPKRIRNLVLKADRDGKVRRRQSDLAIVDLLFKTNGKLSSVGQDLVSLYSAKSSSPSRARSRATKTNKHMSDDPGISSLPKNASRKLPMIRLDESTPSNLTAIIDYAPSYRPRGDLKRLIDNTIGVIHQIPDLFIQSGPPIRLKDIEAYFGRSSTGIKSKGSNLNQRFKAGLNKRRHTYGIIIGTTTLRASQKLEDFSAKMFINLKKLGHLCIANKSISGKGPVGSIEPAFLYMTFRFINSKEPNGTMLSARESLARARNITKSMGKSLDDSSEVDEYRKAAAHGLEKANDPDFVGETSPLLHTTK